MAKRSKQKSTGSTSAPTKKPAEKPGAGQNEDPKTSSADEGSDYGGMPFRDLKKNLGCG